MTKITLLMLGNVCRTLRQEADWAWEIAGLFPSKPALRQAREAERLAQAAERQLVEAVCDV